MAAFNKVNQFVEDVAHGVHDLATDTITVALCNTAPTGADAVLADLAEVSYADCSSRVVTTTSSSETGGLYKLVLTDLTLTSSGTVGPFRYVVLYNDTPTSPADPLVGYYDYGSSITLNNTETLEIDFDAANGALTIQ